MKNDESQAQWFEVNPLESNIIKTNTTDENVFYHIRPYLRKIVFSGMSWKIYQIQTMTMKAVLYNCYIQDKERLYEHTGDRANCTEQRDSEKDLNALEKKSLLSHHSSPDQINFSVKRKRNQLTIADKCTLQLTCPAFKGCFQRILFLSVPQTAVDCLSL